MRARGEAALAALLACAGCRPYVIDGKPPARLARERAPRVEEPAPSRIALTIEVEPQPIADAVEAHLAAGRLSRQLSDEAALYGVTRSPLRARFDRDPATQAPRLTLATQLSFVGRCDKLPLLARVGCKAILSVCGGDAVRRAVGLTLHTRLTIARDLRLSSATSIDPPDWRGACLSPSLARGVDAWIGDRIAELDGDLERLLALAGPILTPRALLARGLSALAKPWAVAPGHVLTLAPRSIGYVATAPGQPLELVPSEEGAARATLVLTATPRLLVDGEAAAAPIPLPELVAEAGPAADDRFHLTVDFEVSFSELSGRIQAWLDDGPLFVNGVRVRGAALRSGPAPGDLVVELTLVSRRWAGTAYLLASPSVAHDPVKGWTVRLGALRVFGITDSSLAATVLAIGGKIGALVGERLEIVKAPSARALKDGWEKSLHEELGAHATLDLDLAEPGPDPADETAARVITVRPDGLLVRLRYDGRARLTLR